VWMDSLVAERPVDNASFSPARPHSETVGRKPLRGVIPFIHTLYDYDKGI